MFFTKLLITKIFIVSLIISYPLSQTTITLRAANDENVTPIEYTQWITDNYTGTYFYGASSAAELGDGTEADGVCYTLFLEQSPNINNAFIEEFLSGMIENDTLRDVVIDGNNFTATAKYTDWRDLSNKEGQITGTFCTLKYKTKNGKKGSVNGLLLSFLEGEKTFFEKIIIEY
ncbi:MAG: hypothetical protein EHM58_17485 [Ignavibacteriae bacterium]|nr:MAG: hypothetical protein EHM58_17485 [Ignavibacteriota bacterium]